MSATTTRPPTSVAKHLLRSQLVGLEVLYAGFVAAVALVGIAIHLFVEVTGSVWSGAIQLIRWFSIGMGVYITAVYLPVYLAHGRTRREIARGSAVFAVALAGWLAVAVLVGFALEAGVYHLLGWAELLLDPHPLASVGRAAASFAQHGVSFLVYIAVGALGGAAFYRDVRLGLLVAPLGLAMLIVSEFLTTVTGIGPLPLLTESVEPLSPWVGLPLGMAVGLVAMALTWPIVRDIPIRTRSN